MQFVDEIQSALSVGRSLHVNAHKLRRIHRRSLGDQTANDVSGQFLVDVQAHVSEFQADIGVEMIGGYGVKNLMIELRAVLGFIRIGDVFAEVIDANAHASAVDGLRGADSVGNLRACNKSSGDAPPQRRSLGEVT